MFKILQEMCKRERETYLQNLIKESKSPLYKKCDKITDFTKKEKCQKEQRIKVSKTPLGKKRESSYKKVMDCMNKEIEKKGCTEKRLQYEKASINVGTKMADLFHKKCGKIKNQDEKMKCMGKHLTKYSKSTEAKKLDKELQKATKEYTKCLSKK